MPMDMKSTLTERFVACFESNPLYARIEASDPLELPYETLHFSWYNRHCTQVSLSELPLYPANPDTAYPRDMTRPKTPCPA